MRFIPSRHLLGISLALVGLTLTACHDDDDRVAAPAIKPRGPTVARTSVTIGTVEVRRANTDVWATLSAGDELERGDLLRTGRGSFVSVKFKTGGGFELEENGLMIIRVAEQPRAGAGPSSKPEQTVVALQSGTARGVFEADEDLIAPLVLEDDDGTRVSLAPSGKEATAIRLSKTTRGTEVAVSEGAAVLTSSAGKKVSLAKGQAADVAKGGTVSDVVELLDYPPSLAPGVDARFQFAANLAIPLAWKPVEKAAGYRVQVARDLGFQALVLNADVDGTQGSFSPKEAGAYAWRIAARDAQGRLGEFGFARRIFAEKEEPKDLLLAPENGASYAFDETKPPPILFAWQSAANATSYRLVISKTPDLLDGPIVDKNVPEQRAEITELVPGEYYWGVYLTGEQPTPVFNQARKVLVVKSTKERFQTPKSISTWGKRK